MHVAVTVLARNRPIIHRRLVHKPLERDPTLVSLVNVHGFLRCMQSCACVFLRFDCRCQQKKHAHVRTFARSHVAPAACRLFSWLVGNLILVNDQ